MIRLAHAYQEVLAAHGVTVAQVLLTLDDSEDRRRYINARNTLTTLLRLGAVPLINENDTVATDEIRFGDNDRLARAGRGDDQRRYAGAALGHRRPLHRRSAHGCRTPASCRRSARSRRRSRRWPATRARAVGTGGMVTKLAAARIAMAAGCRMAIAAGDARASAARASRRASAAPGSCRPRPRRRRASSGSPAR